MKKITQSILLSSVIFCSGIAKNTLSEEKAIPVGPTVVIPYESTEGLRDGTVKRVYIDYDSFQAMWNSVKDHRTSKSITDGGVEEAGVSDYTMTTGLYRIRSSADKIQVDARVSMLIRGAKWQKIPVSMKEVNLSQVRLNGEAAPYQEGVITVEKPGIHLLEFEYEIPLEKGDDIKKWGIPQASANYIEIELDSELAEPALSGGFPLRRQINGLGKAIYTASIGQSQQIELRRRLRTTGRNMTLPNVAFIDTKLFVARGIERVESEYHLQFSGQEEDRFAIDFDAGVTPIEIAIPNLAGWELGEVAESGMRRVAFSLTEPVADEVKVRFVGERLSGLPATSSEEVMRFPEASAQALRTQHRMYLLRGDDLYLNSRPAPGQHRISFPDKSDFAGFHPVAAFSSNSTGEELEYSIRKKQPRRSATASYLFQTGEGKLETVAKFRILSPEAPLLHSSLLLPEESKIQLVTGNRVKDWWRNGNELFVRYQGGTPDETTLLVYLAESSEEGASSRRFQSLSFSDIPEDRVQGKALVVSHITEDVSLRLDQGRTVIREIGIEEVEDESEVLPPLERKKGLRFDSMNFSGDITLEPISPKYDGLWVMLAQVHESWVRMSMHVDVEVTRSGLDRLNFSTPITMPELQVISDEVRELRNSISDNGERREYEIIFQRYIADAISFTLETEIPHDGVAQLSDLVIEGAGRQERFVIVENQSEEEMTLREAGMQSTVESMLPYKPESLVSAKLYRAQPGWSLEAEISQLETTAGTQAVILYADLTTALRRNGEEWLRAIYHIQNRSLQFLPVELPIDSELISVTVAGREVRADQGVVEGREVILIPLIQTIPGQLAYDVELVIRSHEKRTELTKLKKLSRRLDDPDVIGTTIENTLWNIYIPEGHVVNDVEGNMREADLVQNMEAILRCDIDEFDFMNKMAANDFSGTEARQRSVTNGSVILNRIESGLAKLEKMSRGGSKRSSSLRKDLEAQKQLFISNQGQVEALVAETPVFESRGRVSKKVINWGDGNSKEIADRNVFNRTASAEQLKRVGGQVRVNDNLSIGQDFVTAGEKKNNEENESFGNYSQVGKLSEGAGNSKADAKLSLLNRNQILDDGGLVELKQVPKNSKFGKGTLLQSIIGNARSRLSSSMPKDRGVAAEQAQDKTAAHKPVSVQTLVTNVPSEGNIALSADGRNSVRVGFPMEGNALHFQKLKSHATLSIETREASQSRRGKSVLWFGLSLAVLLSFRSLGNRLFA